MTKAESPKPPTKLQTITLKVFIHCEGCRRKVRRIIRVLDGVDDVTVDAASGKVTVTGTADVKTILQRLQKYGKHAEMWPSPTPAPSTAGKAGANQPKSNNNNISDSNNKKKNNGGVEGGEKAAAAATEIGSKKGDGKAATPGATAKGEESAVNESKLEKSKEGNAGEVSDGKMVMQNGGGGGGKKGGKKGGNANNTNNGGGGGGINSGGGGNGNNSGGGNGNVMEVPSPGPPIHDIPIMSAPNTSVMVSANRSLSPYDSIQTGYTYHSADYATHMFSDENANNCSIM